MKTISGTLRKMPTELTNPVQYHLLLDNEKIALNPLLGKTIKLVFTGEIHCIECGRKTNKSFQQGYCFPCYRELLKCNLCMIHPERCPFQGQCPADHWVSAGCSQPHIVYLANSSGLKVGVTRQSQVPTRWIDQGATQALPIFKVVNRYQAGLIEDALKSIFKDKTNWRAMLKGQIEPIDLNQARLQLIQKWQTLKTKPSLKELKAINEITNQSIIEITYPVLQYPAHIKTFDFDKTPAIEGQLLGIKGQYLIFDQGVINIRKFGG